MSRRRKPTKESNGKHGSGANRSHQNNASVARSLPLWKKVLFSLVMVVASFLALELLLFSTGVTPILYERDPYVGFSGYVSLFVEQSRSGATPLMVTAPNKLDLFNPQHFHRDKGPTAYRIFCVGGSTTYGRPYNDATSFCGWLRALLPAADPHRNWEVINAGGISYASYRVAVLMEELARYEPDLCIIYSGHNEFLEQRTYGELLEMPPLVRELNVLVGRTRIYAVIYRLVRGPVTPSSGAISQLPAEVNAVLDDSVGPQDYTRDDDLQRGALAHYHYNLKRMVDIAASVDAGVILVVPASNLAHCSPFKSEHRSGLSRDQLERSQVLRTAAEDAYGRGHFEAALSSLENALPIDDRYADTHYLRGRTLAALSRAGDAKKAFVRARDEDVCPLRALTPMEEIVASVAHEKNVSLVDFAARVEGLSPDGVPGESLFLDHVHPTIDGNRLLARLLLDAMVSHDVVTPSPSWGDAAIEEVVRTVEGRLDPTAHGMALRNLPKVLAWAGKFEEAEGLARRALDLVPEDADAHYNRGFLLEREGKYDEAFAHYEQAIRLAPTHVDANMGLGLGLWQKGQADRALFHLEQAVRIDPENAGARKALGLVLSGLGRLPEAKTQFERSIDLKANDAQAHYDLGVVLGKLGDAAGATAHYRTAVDLKPDYAEAHNNLGLALAGQGDLLRAEYHFERAVLVNPDFAIARQNLEHVRAALKR
jgi:tetratricopeptide (TPR) repeat protein